MKKLLLLLFMFTGLNIFGQSEDFETATIPNIPSGWAQFETGTGTLQSWSTTNLAAFTFGGVGQSALINRENVASGQAIDWLVTNLITVPTNGQLRFFTKTVQTGVQGSLFDIKISTTSQTNPATFTNLISWDEASLTATANVYEEKVIDLTAYPAGTQIYIAFVMTNDNGDRWLIDNMNVVQKCNAPIGPLATSNESTSSAQLSWGNPGGITQWEVEVVPFANAFTGVPSYPVTSNNPFIATGLLPNTLYKFQVRSVCTGGFESDWFGPRSFQTSSFGDTCAGPIVVGALPYQTVDNTVNYLDTNDLAQPVACSGTATNYMTGNDVFYSFTPTFTGNVAINLAPTAANSSIHVYSACPGTAGANCLAGVANNNANPRNINPFPVVAGTTYYIIISSNAPTTQTVGYTLTIQQVFCNQPTGLTANAITSTSANLAWAASAGTTSWQYSFAPAPYGLPTGSSTITTTTSNTVNAVTGIPGIVYQYYVRADCNDGNYSIWAGPFTYTLPQVATPLNFTDGFETLTGWTLSNGTQSNKWAVGTGVNNGGTHALYITDTNGTTNTYNNTSTSVVHAYKDFVIPAGATQLDFTFDWRSVGELQDVIKVWTVPATFNPVVGAQITPVVNSRIKIGNDLTSIPTFTTQNYTLNATPYAGGTMRVVFEWINNNAVGNQPPAAIDNVKLDLITCPKPGNLVISNIGYNAAQVAWANGGSETQWEVLVLPAASPAPNATATGTITNSGSPFQIGGLTSVTCYDVYVRARCSATEFSFWSVPTTFCTTPNYCAGDHFFDTGGISGNYQNNENITSIICPDNAGDVITVVFNDFSLAAGDNLVIRDGNLPTSPIVGTYTGTNLPPSFSATTASGCLTFVFTSTAGGVSAGWDATIYCTPPITCFKPVALTATNIGATTASLSWTESGSATQWEILVLPFGANAPILGQTGIPVNSGPPYIVNGLAPSTTYTFYVRAICSSSNASFWSDGFTFSTTPINDLCLNATTAIVNDDLICSQVNPGTLFGASNTTGVPAGCSPAANDVWYRFVATRSTHTMSLTNVLPAGADVDFALYQGANCTSLTQVQCFTAAQNVVNSLVVGQVYYIRVFSASNQSLDFSLCIGGVPCPEAVSLCNTPITYPNTTNVINLGSYACLGSAPNASFFFLEAAQNGTLAYTISQTSGDVDYALWGPFPTRNFGCGLIPMEETGNGTAYPNDPVQCSYSTAAVENFSINVLQGQVYILMVTNFVNQPGSITITPNPSNTAQSFCYPYNTFNYSAITYCNSSANQSPTLIAGAVAGNYSAVRIEDGSTTAMVINSTTGEINFAASQPGTYTVTSTLIPTLPAPASNAPIITTRTVIITPTPNATIAYSSPTFCKSDTNSQPITITGNSGEGSYFSSTPVGLENALDPVTGSIIPVLGNVGVYTVTLTVPAQGGCPEYTTTTQVEIIASPIIPAQVDINACNSYVLPALTVGNYFTASGGTGTPLTAGDVITTNQTIYVYATNGQCSSEDPFNVNVVSIPTPTFDYLTQPTCAVQTGSINITAPVAVGGTVPSNLFISEVTDANTGSLSYVELYNATGATVNLSGYKLRVFTTGGGLPYTTACDNVLSGTIANNSTFVIKLSNNASIPGVTHNLQLPLCAGVNNNDNIKLTTTANVVIDNWGTTDGSTFTPSGQTGYTYRRLASATPLPSTTWNVADWTAIDPENYSDLGMYTLNTSSYEYSVDGGAYQTNTTFTGIAPGNHTFIVHDLINNCYSAPIPFTINPVPYTNSVTDFTYVTPVCITDTTNPTPTLAAGFTTGGTFSYVGTGLDLNTTNGTINLATSTAGTYVVTYTYPTDLANCINTGATNFTITIDPFVTATFTQIPNICQNTVAPTLPLVSNNNISGTWNAAISTTTPGTTTYTFTPNPGQCGVGTTMNITIDPVIVPTFNAIANICQNAAAPALSTLSNNNISGTWSPSVINTASSGSFNFTFTPDAGQCSQVVSISVTINPNVTPTFTQVAPLCIGDTNVTLPSVSTNLIEGSWSPSVVNTSVEGSTVYTFTPDDPADCASVITMTIQVEFCDIQKGISPNGDGLNDYLELVANKVEIFNRYGKEVYTKLNYNNDWRGQFNGGGEMPDGTYYYVIELVSGVKKTGWIYINREQ
jgi:gliding motility-associated-like protein